MNRYHTARDLYDPCIINVYDAQHENLKIGTITQQEDAKFHAYSHVTSQSAIFEHEKTALGFIGAVYYRKCWKIKKQINAKNQLSLKL